MNEMILLAAKQERDHSLEAHAMDETPPRSLAYCQTSPEPRFRSLSFHPHPRILTRADF